MARQAEPRGRSGSASQVSRAEPSSLPVDDFFFSGAEPSHAAPPALAHIDVDPVDLELPGTSELVDQREPLWFVAPVHPWRRYFARMIDYHTLGLLAYSIACLFVFADSQDIALTRQVVGNQILASVAVTVLMVPVLALFVGLTGFTPGKWLAGIRVVQQWDGRPIGFAAALSRELFIAIKGMALGVPVVNLVTLGCCRASLQRTGSMSWDRSFGATVLYAPTSRALLVRLSLAVAACIASLVWIYCHGRVG